MQRQFVSYSLLFILVSYASRSEAQCQFETILGVANERIDDGGPATSAYLLRPRGVAVDSSGKVYIADTRHNRIRVVRSDGTIGTIAGTGAKGFSGDSGPAISATLSLPEAVFAAQEGSLYIADTGNHRIRRIDNTG